MDKNKICEALYALPDGVVVRRRKSVVVPALTTLAGVALIVLNNMYGAEWGNNLSSSAVFIGGALVLAGAIVIATRIFGSSGVPYHRASKSSLRYEELFFDRKFWGEVVRCVNDGEVVRLRSIEHADVPAVTVAIYSSGDGRFTAMQAFEYADLEYRPLSEVKIVNV